MREQPTRGTSRLWHEWRVQPAPGMRTRAGWIGGASGHAVAVALWSLAVVGLTVPAHAQVARTQPQKVCRALVSTDRGFPQYKSCCDVDGGHSRWVKADGSSETRVSVCALWGIKPGPASLDLPPAERSVDRKLSQKGIPAGSYLCELSVGQPPTVRIQSGGRYSVSDGSSGRFELAERASDGIGGFARYKIAGGSFDGFFFLHRDNGQLQVGRNGWGRCRPV